MSRRGAAQPLEAGLGEHRERAAGVVVTRLPPDEPLALEPVDQPGQTAARDEHPLRQLGHAQPPLGCLDELHQHVIGREWQLVLGEQIRLEPAHQHRMRLEEVPPRPELFVGESPQTSHASIVRRLLVTVRAHTAST